MLLFLALSGVGLLAALGFYTDARNEVLSEMALSQLEALASGKEKTKERRIVGGNTDFPDGLEEELMCWYAVLRIRFRVR